METAEQVKESNVEEAVKSSEDALVEKRLQQIIKIGGDLSKKDKGKYSINGSRWEVRIAKGLGIK